MSTIEAPAIQAPKEVTTADVLHRAADLLEEFGWIQGPYAVNEAGESCEPLDREACGFCLVGSLIRSRDDFGLPPFPEVHEAHYYAQIQTGSGSQWSDDEGRTKSEVVALLREAAERSTG